MTIELCSCHKCGSATSNEDRYCQDCGTFLQVSEVRLDLPIAGRFRTELSPHSAKTTVPIPLIAGIVIALILTPFLICTVEKLGASVSRQFIREQAQTALKNDKPKEALKLLRSLMLNNNNSLTTSERMILNQALYTESMALAQQGSYKIALAELSQISSDYPELLKVQQQLAAWKTLSLQQERQAQVRSNAHRESCRLKQRATKLAHSDDKLNSFSSAINNESAGKADSSFASSLPSSTTAFGKETVAACKTGQIQNGADNTIVSGSELQTAEKNGRSRIERIEREPGFLPAPDRQLQTTVSSRNGGCVQTSIQNNRRSESETNTQQLAPGELKTRGDLSARAIEPQANAPYDGSGITATDLKASGNSAIIPNGARLLDDNTGRPNARQNSEAKSERHFAHKDVVRYNELLAAYFSGKVNRGQKPGQAAEPPSLKEWVDAGRPGF